MIRLLAAISFLTRIPVPVFRPIGSADVGRSALFFPLVGAGVGGLQLLLWQVLEPRSSTLLSATLVVAFGAWLTRALHLDGLADLSDGLAGGRTREDVLRIMRDSRIGPFAVVTLLLLLMTKVAALDAVSGSRALALVLAPALARWTAVVAAFSLPYARAGEAGLGASLTEHVGWLEVSGATVIAAALVLLFPMRSALRLALACAVVAVAVAILAKRRLGGVTGDVLGAGIELVETSALVAAAL